MDTRLVFQKCDTLAESYKKGGRDFFSQTRMRNFKSAKWYGSEKELGSFKEPWGVQCDQKVLDIWNTDTEVGNVGKDQRVWVVGGSYWDFLGEGGCIQTIQNLIFKCSESTATKSEIMRI